MDGVDLTVPEGFVHHLLLDGHQSFLVSDLALGQQKDDDEEADDKKQNEDVRHHVFVEVLGLEATGLLGRRETLLGGLQVFFNAEPWEEILQNPIRTGDLEGDQVTELVQVDFGVAWDLRRVVSEETGHLNDHEGCLNVCFVVFRKDLNDNLNINDSF